MTLPDLGLLRARLAYAVREEEAAGRDVDGLLDELHELPGSYDALDAFARGLHERPMRGDWPYLEPLDLASIRAASDPSRVVDRRVVPDAGARASAAFLGRVCGCMLGKPFEIEPTMAELRDALSAVGEWPLRDYVTEAGVARLREQQGQWRELVRDRIDHVAADDDINYTVIGLLLLERHGLTWTPADLVTTWLYNLPVLATFGPERTLLVGAGLAALEPGARGGGGLVPGWNPGGELCGALIRVDAYGYAGLGDPALATELAYRDASVTHRRTGVYGAMFVAAALAVAPLCSSGEEIATEALRWVPQESRFAEAVRFALDAVSAAASWEDGYVAIHDRFGEYGHCRVLQEIGTLVNTLRFARSVGDGICLQVMQGNDTDSFGATAGSILGAFYGSVEERWVAPFQDRVQLAMATTWVSSVSELAARMAALPSLVESATRASGRDRAGTA